MIIQETGRRFSIFLLVQETKQEASRLAKLREALAETLARAPAAGSNGLPLAELKLRIFEAWSFTGTRCPAAFLKYP